MAPEVTSVALKAALATLVVMAVLPSGVRAVSKWHPAPVRRKIFVPGCMTPRGLMEIGQRVYLPACRRLVCKTYNGQPVIEEQSCDPPPKRVPPECFVKQRRSRRYPDCCPELTCPRANPVPPSPGRMPWGGFYDYPGAPYPEENTGGIGVGGRYPGGVMLPSHYGGSLPRMTPRPFTFYNRPDVVVGTGYSPPWSEPDYSKEASLGERPHRVSEEISAFGSVDLNSPSNSLGEWEGGIPTGGDYDYVDDITVNGEGSYYDDSIALREETLYAGTTPPPWDITSYYAPSTTTTETPTTTPTPATRWTSPYIPPTTYAPRFHSQQNTPRIPITTFGDDPRTWKTSTPVIIAVSNTTPAPLTQSSTNSSSGSSLTYSYFDKPFLVRTSPLPYKHYLGGENSRTEQKTSTTTTHQPREPHTKYRPTITRRTTTPPTTTTTVATSSRRSFTTPSFSWSTKINDDSESVATTPISYEESVEEEKVTSEAMDILYSTDNPQTEPTVRTGYKRRRPTLRSRTTPSLSTSAPYSKVTPNDYRYVAPDLDPQKYDIHQFFHSTIDPSALIPGHDKFLKSKYEAMKEYLKEVGEEEEKESSSENHRARRSLSYTETTMSYEEPTVLPTEEAVEKQASDETFRQRRGRPVFYIPWRQFQPKSLATPTPIVQAEKQSSGLSMTYPPTKYEHAIEDDVTSPTVSSIEQLFTSPFTRSSVHSTSSSKIVSHGAEITSGENYSTEDTEDILENLPISVNETDATSTPSPLEPMTHATISPITETFTVPTSEEMDETFEREEGEDHILEASERIDHNVKSSEGKIDIPLYRAEGREAPEAPRPLRRRRPMRTRNNNSTTTKAPNKRIQWSPPPFRPPSQRRRPVAVQSKDNPILLPAYVGVSDSEYMGVLDYEIKKETPQPTSTEIPDKVTSPEDKSRDGEDPEPPPVLESSSQIEEHVEVDHNVNPSEELPMKIDHTGKQSYTQVSQKEVIRHYQPGGVSDGKIIPTVISFVDSSRDFEEYEDEHFEAESYEETIHSPEHTILEDIQLRFNSDQADDKRGGLEPRHQPWSPDNAFAGSIRPNSWMHQEREDKQFVPSPRGYSSASAEPDVSPFNHWMDDDDFPSEDWDDDSNFGPLFPRDEDDFGFGEEAGAGSPHVSQVSNESKNPSGGRFRPLPLMDVASSSPSPSLVEVSFSPPSPSPASGESKEGKPVQVTAASATNNGPRFDSDVPLANGPVPPTSTLLGREPVSFSPYLKSPAPSPYTAASVKSAEVTQQGHVLSESKESSQIQSDEVVPIQPQKHRIPTSVARLRQSNSTQRLRSWRPPQRRIAIRRRPTPRS